MNYISIIIPNYNGSRTIARTLDAVYAHKNADCEVIVVDDCSEDNSADIIKKYPCRLIELKKRSGASTARNAGASIATGDVFFFIDADCLLQQSTIPVIRGNLSRRPPDCVIGGTYTPVPHDSGFFSLFQSVFVNFFETKNSNHPDYLATHAMVIHAEIFRKAGGFTENFFPILEDIEFSHRLRSAGCSLVVDPELLVKHIFHFSFSRSLANAFRKTRYWITYSVLNRDLLSDSGTASAELKITGLIWLINALLALLSIVADHRLSVPLVSLLAISAAVNRHLFRAFYAAGGIMFSIRAAAYYLLLYPLPVWFGVLRGVYDFIGIRKRPEFRPSKSRE